MVFSRRSSQRRRNGRVFREGRRAAAFAALDLGTNNCRLLVAEAVRDGFKVVDAFSRIVRLGEGLNRTGRLSEAAMGRALDALKVCAGKIRRRPRVQVRGVATEACRKADNCTDFMERIRGETGLSFEIISPEEEARLAMGGCLPLLNDSRPRALVFDIGGGSTQVMWLDLSRAEPELLASLSIPAGVISVSEAYDRAPLSRAQYEDLIDGVGVHLEPFCEEFGIRREIQAGAVQMLGTSGTVTTLAGLQLGLPRYDRSRVDGVYLHLDAVRSLSDDLRSLSYTERAARPCVGSDRADLVVAGCAILEALCDRWPVDRLRVADRGVREGILVDLMGRPNGA